MLFGLSRAEAQVAALLNHGLNLAEIAELLEISRHTARVHLNAILTKTGTHRQPMLMQRLDAGPNSTAQRAVGSNFGAGALALSLAP